MAALDRHRDRVHDQNQLLRGARSSLSLVWIAATFGSKAHVKRITKRQLLSLDVPAACQLIAAPGDDGQTLPLRISSTLLSGVSRVYGQQYAVLFSMFVLSFTISSCFLIVRVAIVPHRNFARRGLAAIAENMNNVPENRDSY